MEILVLKFGTRTAGAAAAVGLEYDGPLAFLGCLMSIGGDFFV